MFLKTSNRFSKFHYRIFSYYRERKKRRIFRLAVWSITLSPTVVYIVWTFFFFAVKIEGIEMLPTFEKGQWLFFSRNSYGMKIFFQHDVPRNRNVQPKIKRGDIVAFINPTKKTEKLWLKILDYPVYALTLGFVKLNKRPVVVRRILGLPKERLEVKDKKIYINDKRYDLPWEIISRDLRIYSSTIVVRDNIPPVFIPGGYVFVMNDNWDILSDSRIFHLIPIHLIEGKMIGD